MADAVSHAVLITGCSSGIGRATAERLAARGFTVYATARRVESIADLEARGCRVLALDVTEEESRQAAVAAVCARWSTTPATASRARSRTSRSTTSAGSSRRTC